MNLHRYILEPYAGMKTKHLCPNCGKSKVFVRYVDTENNNVHIAIHVGRCDRAVNCCYHYTPKQYFEDNKPFFETINQLQLKSKNKNINTIVKPIPISFISLNTLKSSLQCYKNNNFITFITQLFGNEIVTNLIETYFIGTSKYWNEATVFWQIDIKGNIRTGKIMLYHPATGKRVKQPFNHIQWVHKVLKIENYNLEQCFFGEHLINKHPKKPIAIVESEKTAIIASLYFPQYIWLAAGSKEGLNIEKCKVLKGRQVTLFPDLNCFEDWSKKQKELSNVTNFVVSDFLELHATAEEKQQGLDIADYLIKFPNLVAIFKFELALMSEKFIKAPNLHFKHYDNYCINLEKRLMANNINVEQFVSNHLI